jgi:nitroimidazol reductase NimA-like FMN-containing flavoprotein (pyridoxamine 5'-phosphate oxidase superfamily)
MIVVTGRSLQMSDASLEVLGEDECVELLRAHEVGRVAVEIDGVPAIFPINYRLVETRWNRWIALRTRPGNVIDRPQALVAFEIDFIDALHHSGWSVLVRGTLHQVSSDVSWIREQFDSFPWLEAERDSWLIVDPFEVTGRRLQPAESPWTYDPHAYW